jgi:hypothetical protein
MSAVDFMAEIRSEIYFKGMQMKKPHKLAEFIIAKANGEVVQRFAGVADGKAFFKDMEDDDWNFPLHGTFRIKPEPKSPETRMTNEELDAVSDSAALFSKRTIANAAIRRAIQDGDVVLPGEKE